MNSRDRLVLLADKLDAKGLVSEASIVDGLIIKRSFDDDTRTNLRSVIQSIEQLVSELSEATHGRLKVVDETTGEDTFEGGLEQEKRDFFSERLESIRQAVGYIGDLSAELEEDTPWPEDDSGLEEPRVGEDAGAGEDAGEDAGEEEEHWWERFKGKFKSPPSEEGDTGGLDPEAGRPPEGRKTPPGPGPDRDSDEELEDEEFETDTGTVKRTSGRGVTVEQSMSNIGNVNIGE
jgi:hypothetical protein